MQASQTGPGEATKLLKRREVPNPTMQKFFSRKSKKPEQESKAGMHERVRGHATPWTD
jgi:hypothetical protein